MRFRPRGTARSRLDAEGSPTERRQNIPDTVSFPWKFFFKISGDVSRTKWRLMVCTVLHVSCGYWPPSPPGRSKPASFLNENVATWSFRHLRHRTHCPPLQHSQVGPSKSNLTSYLSHTWAVRTKHARLSICSANNVYLVAEKCLRKYKSSKICFTMFNDLFDDVLKIEKSFSNSSYLSTTTTSAIIIKTLDTLGYISLGPHFP